MASSGYFYGYFNKGLARQLTSELRSRLMGMLHNARHEVFAQELAKGSTQAQAARVAGYSDKTITVAASKLAHRPDISERVNELRDRGNKLAIVEVALSKEWVLTELQNLYFVGKRKEQVSAATRCLELIGKEIGMFQDVISREMFNLMMAAMGAAVTRFVPDLQIQDQIVQEWERISIAEPRQLRAGILPRSGTDPQSADS